MPLWLSSPSLVTCRWRGQLFRSARPGLDLPGLSPAPTSTGLLATARRVRLWGVYRRACLGLMRLRRRWNSDGKIFARQFSNMRRDLWQWRFVRRYVCIAIVTGRHVSGRNSAGLGRDQQRRRQPTNSRSGTKFFYADNKWSSFANCRNWHSVRDNRLIHACNWLLKWQPVENPYAAKNHRSIGWGSCHSRRRGVGIQFRIGIKSLCSSASVTRYRLSPEWWPNMMSRSI